MHIAIAPVLLGSGERFFEGIDLPALGYVCTKHEATPLATHVIFIRQWVNGVRHHFSRIDSPAQYINCIV